MGGNRSLVRYFGYALLAVVVLAVAGLATLMAAFPGPTLHPLVALAAVSTLSLVVIWAGLATYSVIRSHLERLNR